MRNTKAGEDKEPEDGCSWGTEGMGKQRGLQELQRGKSTLTHLPGNLELNPLSHILLQWQDHKEYYHPPRVTEKHKRVLQAPPENLVKCSND